MEISRGGWREALLEVAGAAAARGQGSGRCKTEQIIRRGGGIGLGSRDGGGARERLEYCWQCSMRPIAVAADGSAARSELA